MRGYVDCFSCLYDWALVRKYRMTTMKKALCLLVSIGFVVSIVQADNFVYIGDAGNADDININGSFGAVSYGYSIGRNEVTIKQFSDSGVGTATGAVGTPAVNVSWNEAAMYCNWLTSGNRLSGAYQADGGSVTGLMSRAEILDDGGLFYVIPTIDEWYKAAYYKGSDSYAVYANGLDNSSAPVAGSDSNYDDARSAPWLVDSGLLEQNGTKNMMGNVYEWTQSGGGEGVRQSILGGSYASGSQSLKSWNDSSDLPPGDESSEIGFRVVAIPEPGTISLLGLSTVGLFLARTVRRRKRVRTLMPVRYKKFFDAYCSQEEWDMLVLKDVHEPHVIEVARDNARRVSATWGYIYKVYNRIDVAYWNYMVSSHDRHSIKRKTFWLASKKKALSLLDNFLALIMR